MWVFSIQRIEKIEEVEDVVMAEQKEMLLILFQRLVIVLSNHFQRCEADGVSTQTMWLHRTLGHLREISPLCALGCTTINMRPFAAVQLSGFMATLDTVVFSSRSVDARLTAVFQQIKSAPYLLH